ncbi:hypothetical protein B5X24_HaOG204483 [Helicoverpa armigera]|uniref:Uncharacterized protein n=1 Tax=Helicoverpa armigera TaxID=29058 RepID=A0A2W1BNI9_HELAM|nr:hypothetical protein B5X24_HaOG204483 [Helicoverpa armigera]
MTKMNGINLPDMTDRDLTVEDIFNENFNLKRKKLQVDYEEPKKSHISDPTKFVENNNVINKSEAPQNMKRKSKTFADNYDIDKIVQSNMIIDKESSKLRLEMRQIGDLDYKTNGHVGNDITEVGSVVDGNEYAMKNGNDIRMDGGDDKMMNNEGGDYINGNDEHGSDVSNKTYLNFHRQVFIQQMG